MCEGERRHIFFFFPPFGWKELSGESQMNVVGCDCGNEYVIPAVTK